MELILPRRYPKGPADLARLGRASVWFSRALIGIVILNSFMACAKDEFRLSSADKVPCPIVISAQTILSEQYAAQELQHYLKAMTGVDCPVVQDTAPFKRRQREILLGDNAHSRQLGLNIDLARLGSEGFELRTWGNKLIIVGGQPRGTLYGVYSLLEDKLGVRWFTPELEYVPRTNQVILAGLKQTFVPAFEYREV